MKSSKQLQAEIETLQAKVSAIQAVAQQDNRDLLADEQTEIDSIVGDDKNPGQISNLAKERERAIWGQNRMGFPWCCPSLTHRVVMNRLAVFPVPVALVASIP